MRYKLYKVVLMVMCAGFVMAQEKLSYSPYLGGSPFPSGNEPSLTHVVNVYWTTMDNMETRISIQAKGDRPTQLHCVKVDGQMNETVASSIAPDCTYDIIIKSVKDNRDSWYAKGQGNLTLKVYGFKHEDFDTPPVVLVQYLKDEQLIGKTEIVAKSVPKKLILNK